MTEILAEAGRITGLGPEIGGKIIFGLQPASAKYTGQKPTMFVAPASQLTDLVLQQRLVISGPAGVMRFAGAGLAVPSPV